MARTQSAAIITGAAWSVTAASVARACTAALVVGSAACTTLLTYPPPSPEVCNDRVDNDLDGLVDALDPDCQKLGHPCVDGDPCSGGVCGQLTTGARVCTPRCDHGEACPTSFTCDTTRSPASCTCTPCAERCNGLDDDCNGVVDDNSCATGEVCEAGACVCHGRSYTLGSDEVDLLFVIDDSPSMAEEQLSVRTALPALVAALTTGDIGGDGTTDFPPVQSLHVGVITGDIGDPIAPSAPIPACDALGDQAILRPPGSSCPVMATSSIFDYSTLGGRAADLVAQVSCAVAAGTRGCGFQQPLEASLQALSPSQPTPAVRANYVAPTFLTGMGRGDMENAGFLRPDSTLVVVVVTDADDCSLSDPEITNPADPTYTGDLNARCLVYPEGLQRLDRYVDGLLQLRRDPASLLVAFVIGVPEGVETESPTDILALPAMQLNIVTDDRGMHAAPACTSPTGDADPGRRMVALAGDLECAGATASIQSICAPTFDAGFDAILHRFADAPSRRLCLAAH